MTASTIKLNTTPEDHHIARMAAVALGLTILENAIPSPLPGVKPGLANIVVLLVLHRYGIGTAAWVSLLRDSKSVSEPAQYPRLSNAQAQAMPATSTPQ